MGRLVITHSTYLDGLIPLLKILANDPAIDTITPAVICRVKGRCEGLKLRVSCGLKGGHKVLARRGSSAQEVFIVTQMSKSELQQRLEQLNR
ncbi:MULTISPECIES: DUF2103 domain-containing protein [Synechococcus]|uniref:Metal-binding protein n=1 Tax=Synechococcus lacustris str. Tous TaxID=1910958 RepID=A0A2P7EHH7_9SYNE|nr:MULTISPECIES: DUF2103 domain-containing protein [Synechococcus]MCF8134031.1 DUF2103 domain-containing protein [Synechococcus lacustris]NBV69894.1 hypothetical protein [Synechococcaceae bacterium WB4_2_0805]NCU75646.1 hypothetical protein [Synechococcaceae bacterium WB7_1C_051]NDA74956.1 hypothetical protein [Synechococcaceae bacterium WB8_3_299]NDD20829.1 hypothetical protein [Synechococcaceae bacterium WBA_3_309]NDE21319.1 hypothetical protein [Synechococcaceae bacterium WB9_3_282]HBU263